MRARRAQARQTNVCKKGDNSAYKVSTTTSTRTEKICTASRSAQYYISWPESSTSPGVHDPGEIAALAAGMVITVEPAFYIPEEISAFESKTTSWITESAQILEASPHPRPRRN